jgi:hypothetical protein
VLLLLPGAVVSGLPWESIVLPDHGEAALREALDAIERRYGSARALIHLSPLRPDGGNGLTFTALDQALARHPLLCAKLLSAALQQSATSGRSSFMTIARLDGCLGLGNSADYSALAGSLFGLTKSLRHEWPEVFCRALDLDPQLDAATAAATIIAELHDSCRALVEVGYGPAGRWTIGCVEQRETEVL